MSFSEEEWIMNEDIECRNERINRLKWIIKNYPKNIEWSSFDGGLKTFYLFEEARYCFVYGQYIATIILSLSYIENELLSFFYGAGINKLKKLGMKNFLRKANEEGLISDSEFELFDKVRKIRNPYVHFTEPSYKNSLEFRKVKYGKEPYIISEKEAKIALKACFKILERFSY